MGQIVKARVKRDYVILKNKVAQDDTLSWQALGLLTYLMSLPDDWTIRKMQLYAMRETNGRASTESAFNELIDKRFIYSVEKRDANGQFVGIDYIVYNEPPDDSPIAENPQAGNPQADKPIAENQQLQKKERTKEINDKGNRGQSPDLSNSKNFMNGYVAPPSLAESIEYFTGRGQTKEQAEIYYRKRKATDWRGIVYWRDDAEAWILQNKQNTPKHEPTWR